VYSCWQCRMIVGLDHPSGVVGRCLFCMRAEHGRGYHP
jgi:hypothetical protein